MQGIKAFLQDFHRGCLIKSMNKSTTAVAGAQAPINSMSLLILCWHVQNMEYKFVELLSCQFQTSSDEHVKQQVTYRYNAVKSRLALMQARLADINALVSWFFPRSCIAHPVCNS